MVSGASEGCMDASNVCAGVDAHSTDPNPARMALAFHSSDFSEARHRAKNSFFLFPLEPLSLPTGGLGCESTAWHLGFSKL